MDVLSFSFVLFSGQQKSSVPCPGLLKGPAKGTKLIKFTAPRYHPVSARLFRKPRGAQNAVTGRTVRPYCRSGRPLGSELQPAPARKPSQPVKLLSLLQVPAYSLRRCVWSIQVVVILITENHLITFWGGLQAQRADFKEYPHFSCFSG
jgi:hypothetical protein